MSCQGTISIITIISFISYVLLCIADVVFILDSSISVMRHNFKQLIEFVTNVLRSADIDSGKVRVAMITFDTDIYVPFHLNSYSSKQQVFSAVRNASYTFGNSNIAGALKMARSEIFSAENGDRSNVSNIAILLTDGLSNVNADQTLQEASMTRMAGIQIFAVGIGLSNISEINRIASRPIRDNLRLIPSFYDLVEIVNPVFSAICSGRIAGPSSFTV